LHFVLHRSGVYPLTLAKEKMENPYWTSDGQKHYVNLKAVKELCFDLLNIVAASKSIAEEIEYIEIEEDSPVNLGDFPLVQLHREYAFKYTSENLLHLALIVRTYDDQMKESSTQESYLKHVEVHDTGDYIGTLSNKEKFHLREACNKIIHATEIRPLYKRIDRMVCDAMDEGKIGRDIWYLTGEIELTGIFKSKSWDAVLHLKPFLEVCLAVTEFGISIEQTNTKS